MYIITGVTTRGKRFRRYCESYLYARCINLYRGTIWEAPYKHGKRKLIHRVWN